MSERDLRALDLRHTLPNLKNLLLTLTSGEAAILKPRPRKKASGFSRSASLITENTATDSDLPVLRHLSPSSAPSDHESEGSSTHIEPTLPTTPTASKVVIEPDEIAPGTAPAAVEPPQSVKKSFYSPIATFLRTRYPSVRAAPSLSPQLINVKVEVETPSETIANPINATAAAEAEEGDADETSTIRGSVRSKSSLSHKQNTEEGPS
jgi:UV radiation resistance-associated gene protein